MLTMTQRNMPRPRCADELHQTIARLIGVDLDTEEIGHGDGGCGSRHPDRRVAACCPHDRSGYVAGPPPPEPFASRLVDVSAAYSARASP